MEDDELRAEFAHLLTPDTRISVPGLPEITRRMRRRQLRQATAGVLACAVVVAAAGLARSAVTPPVTGQAAAPRCAQSDLRVSWRHVRGPSGVFNDLPPFTSEVVVRNISRAACTITGWPRLMMSVRHPLQSQTVYGTINSIWLAHHKNGITRWTLPTSVELRPRQAALSAVTVSIPPDILGCDTPRWTVLLPVAGATPLLRRHGPTDVCVGSQIVVSPFFPETAPLTRNYPYPQLTATPASPTNAAPPGDAGPDAAPWFAQVDLAKEPAPVIIRAWRTGQVTATIQPPAGSGPEGFTGVAATGDDRTMVLATTIGGGNGAASGHLRFYQLNLVYGRPLAAPAPLPVPPVAEPGSRFAVSVDGSELALALRGRNGTAKIMVVSLAWGAVRTWTSSVPGSVTALSWARPDKLAFVFGANAARSGQSGLRMLDTAAPGRDLLAAPLLIPASVRFGTLSGLNYPLISPDGTTVFVTMTSRTGGATRAAVVQFSARTGQPEYAVTPETGESGMGTWCGALWSDPAGSTALAVCGIQGEIHNAKFAQLDLHFPAQNFSAGVNVFAF